MVALSAAVLATLMWNAPTHYTDGNILPPEHIDYYTVMGSRLTSSLVTTDTTILVDVPVGYQCFMVAVTATNGLSSEWGVGSSLVCKDILGDFTPETPVLVCP